MNENQHQPPPQVVYYVPQPQGYSTTSTFVTLLAVLFALAIVVPIAGLTLFFSITLAMDSLAGFLVAIPVAALGFGLSWLIVRAALKI